MKSEDRRGESSPGVVRELIRLALPLSFIHFSVHLTSLVDTIVAGHLGDAALAGVGLGSSTFFTASIFGLGVGLGLDPIISQALGGGRSWDARHALWQGLYLALLMSVPMGVLAVGIAENLHVFGVVPEVAEDARVYVWARLLNVVGLYGTVVLRSYLQAAHRIRPIVISAVVANVANLVLDILLAFGDEGWVRWGLPPLGLSGWGVAGIGWASTLTGFLQLGVLALATRGVRIPALQRSPRELDWRLIRRLTQIGAPIGTQLLAEVGIFTLVQVIMATISTRAAAAHQTALMLSSLSFSVCLGIGAATAVQVGRAIGADDLPRARAAGMVGIGVSVLFMLVPAGLMVGIPGTLCGWITADPDVLNLAVQLLMIAAVYQVVDGAQAVASGALRGVGVTRWAMGAHLVSHWLVGFPLGLFLGFGLGMGPSGFWWGLTAGLGAAAISLSVKFFRVSAGSIEALRVD